MTVERRWTSHIRVFAFVLVLLCPLTVCAADYETARLTITACPTVIEAEAARVFHIELHTIAAGKREVHAAPTDVTATCQQERVYLRATLANQPAIFSKTLPLTANAADGNENSRLLAIAAAELVFTAWVAISSQSSPKKISSAPSRDETNVPGSTDKSPTDKSLKSDPENSTANRNPRPLLTVELGPSWQVFTGGASHVFGGTLSIGCMPASLLFIRAGLTVEGGIANRSLGSVSLFVLSGAAAVGVRKQIQRALAVGAELGGRFGFTSLSGKAVEEGVDASDLNGGFGGPVLGLFVNGTTNPYVAVNAEVGYALFGILGRVEQGDSVTTRGVWVSTILALGVGF